MYNVFVLVSTVDVDAVLGRTASLPCDVTPDTKEDRVYMVLWFRAGKASGGKPIYRYDFTNGNFLHLTSRYRVTARTNRGSVGKRYVYPQQLDCNFSGSVSASKRRFFHNNLLYSILVSVSPDDTWKFMKYVRFVKPQNDVVPYRFTLEDVNRHSSANVSTHWTKLS